MKNIPAPKLQSIVKATAEKINGQLPIGGLGRAILGEKYTDIAIKRANTTSKQLADTAAKLRKAETELAAATAATKREKARKAGVKKIDAAMRLRRQRPDLTDAAVAEAVGCDPSYLSRHTEYQAVAAEAIRAAASKAAILSRVEKKPSRRVPKSQLFDRHN